MNFSVTLILQSMRSTFRPCIAPKTRLRRLGYLGTTGFGTEAKSEDSPWRLLKVRHAILNPNDESTHRRLRVMKKSSVLINKTNYVIVQTVLHLPIVHLFVESTTKRIEWCTKMSYSWHVEMWTMGQQNALDDMAASIPDNTSHCKKSYQLVRIH
jgi:hypothetical protein